MNHNQAHPALSDTQTRTQKDQSYNIEQCLRMLRLKLPNISFGVRILAQPPMGPWAHHLTSVFSFIKLR